MRNGLWLASICAVLGAASGAVSGAAAQTNGVATQSAGQGNDSLYRKAQDMVANGDATAGRALLDSLMHATSPDSVSYANALYWHAGLATSAADAELDYRRIIVDYPTSPRVQDALLRIGQLELTRGEYDEALQHLRRIPAEYPNSPQRARANYWIARTLFEKNDITNACAASADAEAHVGSSDVELKNQIDYQQQQCRGVAVAPPKSTSESTPESRPPTPAVVTPPPRPTPRHLASVSKQPVEETHPKPAEDTLVEASAPANAPASTPAKPAVQSAEEGGYSVQVAAFYDRTQADALAAKLRTRGYTSTRVEGEKAPFRVRMGHFKTHAAAAQLLATLKAKKITGFVAEE